MSKSELFIFAIFTEMLCIPDRLLPEFFRWASRISGLNLQNEADFCDESVWETLQEKCLNDWLKIISSVK